MEDEHVHVDNFAGSPDCSFFAVMDGHGGRGVVEKVKDYLPENLAKEIEKMGGPIGSGIAWDVAFKNAFNDTDAQVKKELPLDERSGCTAVVAVLTRQGKERVVHVANIGDSRAVLNRKGQAIRLNYDHKATDESEKKRIEAAGGMMIMGKVGGILGVTRAFGDYELKESPWLITDPHVEEIKIQSGDSYVLLACDGLFDVCEDQEVANLLNPKEESQALSEMLVRTALERGSRDNISVMVVKL